MSIFLKPVFIMRAIMCPISLSLQRNLFLEEITAQRVDCVRIYEITSASLHVSVALRFWLHFYATRAHWQPARSALPADPAAAFLSTLTLGILLCALTAAAYYMCNSAGCIIEGGWLTASFSESHRRGVLSADFDLARAAPCLCWGFLIASDANNHNV